MYRLDSGTWSSQQQTAGTTRDIVQAARQELTIERWDNHRSRYELLSSNIVMNELARGEQTMAKKRLELHPYRQPSQQAPH